MPKADLPKIIADYDVLIVRSATKVRGELLDNAKNLKVIGRAGEGLDNVDYEKAQNLGIALINTPHVSYISVSELTIGHILPFPETSCKPLFRFGRVNGKKNNLWAPNSTGKP